MFVIENGDSDSAALGPEGIVHQFLCHRVRYLISYRRILQLTASYSVRTVNPDDFTMTNDFSFDEIVRLVPNESDPTAFTIELRVNKGTEKLVPYFYTSEYRTEVLCRLHEFLLRAKILKARRAEDEGSEEGTFVGQTNSEEADERYYSAKRLRKQGSYNSTSLVVKPYGLVEVDARTGKMVQTYYYFNMSDVSSNQDASFVFFSYSGRIKIFVMVESASDLPELTEKLSQALSSVGIGLQASLAGATKTDGQEPAKVPIIATTTESLKSIVDRRNTIHGEVTGPGPVCTFEVTKHSRRHGRPMPRQIQINEEYMVEKDSSGFQTVSFYKLHSIFSFVRSWANTREFSIEFDNGSSRRYSASSRDSMLAVLLDVCHAIGNVRVVVLTETSQHARLLPRHVGCEALCAVPTAGPSSFQEVLFGARTMEYHLLSRLTAVLEKASTLGIALSSSEMVRSDVSAVCVEFVSNIGYPGVSPDADASLVSRAVLALLVCINYELVKCNDEEIATSLSVETLVLLLQALCRVIPCVAGYKGFVEVERIHSRRLLIQLMLVQNDIVNFWALEVLKLLCCCPHAPRNVKQEFVNKTTLLTDDMILAVVNLISVDPASADTSEEEVFLPSIKEMESSDLSVESEETGSVFKDVASPVPPSTGTGADAARDRNSSTASNASTGSQSEASSVPSASRIMKNIGGVFGPNGLVVMSAASLLESVLSSRRDTTAPELVTGVMHRLGQRCEMLLHMLQTISFVVLENAAILMHILLKRLPEVAPALKEVALSEGLALKHFYNAVYSPSSTQRYISRFLVATWMSGDEREGDAGKALLTRILPRGLVEFLKSPPFSRPQKQYLEELEEEYYDSKAAQGRKVSPIGFQAGAGTRNLTKSAELQLRMRRRISRVLKERTAEDDESGALGGVASVLGIDGGTPDPDTSFSSSAERQQQSYSSMCIEVESSDWPQSVFSNENWRMLFHMIIQNHKIPDLIWTETTRLELRKELETELRNYEREKRLRGGAQVAWNFQQFKVFYPSLRHEMQVGPIYVRHFLEADATFLRSIGRPSHTELFERLFRRVLGNIDSNAELSILCARCLVRLYSVCCDLIVDFDDAMLGVHMLEQSAHLELQHCILELLDQLSRVDLNLHQLLNKEFVDVMVRYASLAHLNPDQIGNVLARSFRANEKLLLERGDDRHTSRDSDALDASENEEFGFDGYNGDFGGTWRDSVIAAEIETFSSFDGEQGKKKEVANSEISVAEREARAITRENRLLWAPEDDVCPRIWFTAPSDATIPPPVSKQRGPYRVSELVRLWDEGEIDRYSIAAPSLHTAEDAVEGEKFDQLVDTGKWRPLSEYFQLRVQLLLPGKAVYSPSDVSAKALGMLKRVSLVHKAYDARGLPFHPTPASRRIMSDPEHLAVFAQLLLSNEVHVVDEAASVLYHLVEHNKGANSKLYLSGVFYYALRYTGNDFGHLARLLQATHLTQSTHFVISQAGRELRKSQKSILSNMLPESLINALIERGPARFAEVFTGEHDTPEVVWNHEFRMHVAEMINQHLGSFPAALRQHTLGRYEYCPIPTIHFPELDKELYVHKYYLNNLCNDKQFPDWPVDEPLVLLRDTVERWRSEMAKGIPDKAITEAKEILSITAKNMDSTELRKAYRQLARRYHPDRNPAGREMFEKVQSAYELLSSVEMKDSDTDLSSVLLLIKTQNLVYSRYPETVSDQKYPAYGLLLRVATIPNFPVKLVAIDERESHRHTKYKVSRKSMGFGRSGAVESSDLVGANGASVYLLYECAMLLYHTCTVSPLNSRELVRTGCMDRLYRVMCFSMEGVDICTKSAATAGHAGKSDTGSYLMFSVCCKILVHSIKAFAAVSLTEIGRQGILDLCPSFTRTLYKILLMNESLPLAAESAIKLIARCCTDQTLQHTFVESGCFWPLLPLLLSFDGTLEHANLLGRAAEDTGYATPRKNTEATRQRRIGSVFKDHASVGFGESQRETHNQNSCNMHAILAAQALGRLAGLMMGDLASPAYPEVRKALQRLLTPSICKLLRNSRPWELLAALNSNSETPTKIWNAGMRAELLAFIKKASEGRRSRLEREDAEADGATEDEQRELAEAWAGSTGEELLPCDDFHFSCLINELFIGGVYVRIFNRLQGDVTEIDDPSQFCLQLLLFLCSHTEEPHQDYMGRHGKQELLAVEQEDRSEDQMVASYFLDARLKEPEVRSAHLELAVLGVLVLAESQDYIAPDITTFPRGICALFGLLSRKYSSKALTTFIGTAKLIAELSGHRPFVRAAASCALFPNHYCVLQLLFCVCQSSEEKTCEWVWGMCHQFTSFAEGLDGFLEQGAVVRLLGCVFGVKGYASSFKNREEASALLSKLCTHPVQGAETGRKLQQFLPLPVAKLLAERPGPAALRLFDETCESPEMIWTKPMKAELRDVLSQLLMTKFEETSAALLAVTRAEGRPSKTEGVPGDTVVDSRGVLTRDGSTAALAASSNHAPSEAKRLPEIKRDYVVPFTRLAHEISVGNVYLKHYLKQPTFRLSNPIFTLEKVVELWESVFKRLVPLRKAEYSFRDSLLTLTAAALPFLRDSISPATPKTVTYGNREKQGEDYEEGDARGKARIEESRMGAVVTYNEDRVRAGNYPTDSSPQVHFIGERENTPVIIPDTQLLLLLTQTVGCIVRSESSTLAHLMSWGVTNTLCQSLRICLEHQQQQEKEDDGEENNGDDSNAKHKSQYNQPQQQQPVSICITCTVDLLNLLAVRVEAVDELAASNENVILCLKQVLHSPLAKRDQRGSPPRRGGGDRDESPFAKPLPAYTSAVLKLLLRIFQSDMSMNLLYFVQAAINCNLPDFLLDDVICAPIAAFETINLQLGGNHALSSNGNAQTVRLQAAEVIKAILHADDEEYYTVALRILLDGHPVWKDFGYQSHGLYAIAEQKIDKLLTIDDASSAAGAGASARTVDVGGRDNRAYSASTSGSGNSAKLQSPPRLSRGSSSPSAPMLADGTPLPQDSGPESPLSSKHGSAADADAGAGAGEGEVSSSSARRPSFTSTSDVINFQRLSAGAALSASASVSASFPSLGAKQGDKNPFAEGTPPSPGTKYGTGTSSGDASNVLQPLPEKVDEEDTLQLSESEAGDLSRHQQVMQRLSLLIEEQQRDARKVSLSQSPGQSTSDSTGTRAGGGVGGSWNGDMSRRSLGVDEAKRSRGGRASHGRHGQGDGEVTKDEEYEEEEDEEGEEEYSHLFRKRGDVLEFHTTIEKGLYGLGLDLSKAPEGGTLFLQYKSVSAAQGGPNLAPKAVPPLIQGDKIIAVNGERWDTFAETVKALRFSRGQQVELSLERRIA